MLRERRVARVAMHQRRTVHRRAHAIEGQIGCDDEAGRDAVRIRMDVAEIAGDARAGAQPVGGRREHLAGARAVARVAVAAFVHLQRVIAVRRQADQVVGDLHAVRALDERHRTARLRADRRLQLGVGPFFVRRGKGGTAGQQAQRGGGQQRAPRAAGAHAVMSLFHSILMPADGRLTRRPRRAGKGTREKSP